jgi:hypothetical protein
MPGALIKPVSLKSVPGGAETYRRIEPTGRAAGGLLVWNVLPVNRLSWPLRRHKRGQDMLRKTTLALIAVTILA